MTRWAPFLWLTGIVLVLLLGLARLSSTMVGDDRTPPEADGATAGPAEPTASGPVVHADSPAASRPETIQPGDDGVVVEPADEPTGDPALRGGPGSATTAAADAPTGFSRERPERVELSTGMLLANVALTQGLVGLAIAAGIWWFEIPGSAFGLTADPWIGGLPALGLGLAFGVALWLGNETVAGIADAAGTAYDETVRSMLAPDTIGGWAILLGLVLPTVAVVEELLFRGALIGVPAAALGLSPWLLAVLSSIAFALGHGAQGRVGIAVTGVLGFVLAAGYVLSGSLLVVIVAHYLVNAMEFVVHEGLGVDRLF